MLLEVRNLRVAFRRDGREIVPVRDVSFAVPEHGRVALVGESGCGKSLTALSLRRLSPTDRAAVSGTVTVPPRLKARNAGEFNRCKTSVMDGVVYVCPTTVGFMLSIK